jgi:hypothetical protein
MRKLVFFSDFLSWTNQDLELSGLEIRRCMAILLRMLSISLEIIGNSPNCLRSRVACRGIEPYMNKTNEPRVLAWTLSKAASVVL